MRAARGKPIASAREVALRMLARRDYSRSELTARLRSRGIAVSEIGTTLDDFERLGYLSDARYAQGVVAQRTGRYGKRAIARNLREKGIDSTAAVDALATLAARDELADATALWQRRFGQAPADERDKARQVRFLVSRGYSAAIAFKVLRAVGAQSEEDAG